MSLDHDAIRRAYPEVITVDDGFGAFDKDNKVVSLEQSKIDEARNTINAEAVANKYKTDRTTDGSTTYAPTGDQLGMLYDDIIAGKLDATGSFAIHNKTVKT